MKWIKINESTGNPGSDAWQWHNVISYYEKFTGTKFIDETKFYIVDMNVLNEIYEIIFDYMDEYENEFKKRIPKFDKCTQFHKERLIGLLKNLPNQDTYTKLDNGNIRISGFQLGNVLQKLLQASFYVVGSGFYFLHENFLDMDNHYEIPGENKDKFPTDALDEVCNMIEKSCIVQDDDAPKPIDQIVSDINEYYKNNPNGNWSGD